MGGEKLRNISEDFVLRGSPPHGRGKVPRYLWPRIPVRITPAWAGKRLVPQQLGGAERDHPRMGGEKPLFAAAAARGRGSPPHGRGKDMDTLQTVHDARITPAWAGKRWTVAGTVAARWDHPRMGGEKKRMPVKTDKRMGSPPHGRGKADPRRHRTRQAGITPAWAGKSRLPRVLYLAHEDHPRMGGEKTKKIP